MFYVYLLHSISDNGFYIGFSTDAEKDIRAQTRRFICDQIARAMEFIMMPTLSAKMPKAGKNILKAGQADVFCAHSYGIT